MKPILSCLVAVGAALLTWSCRREPGIPIPEAGAAEHPAGSGQAEGIPPAVEKAIREKGERVAAQAYGVLSSRLGRAMAEAGYTNAVEFCSVHGITLTTSVGVTNEVVLRRVTHRPRNPENRADTNELALIRRYEAELKRGATPTPVVLAARPGVFTYYSPIVLNQSLCLRCHGQPGTDILPDMLAQLKRSHPADEATGFKLGELRGLWSVDFKRTDFAVP